MLLCFWWRVSFLIERHLTFFQVIKTTCVPSWNRFEKRPRQWYLPSVICPFIERCVMIKSSVFTVCLRICYFWNIIPFIFNLLLLVLKSKLNSPFVRSSIRNSFVSSHAKSFARIASFLLNASFSAYKLLWD